MKKYYSLKIINYCILILCASVIFACNSRTPAPKEAENAFNALQKLKIATESGTDEINYNRLLTDARFMVNAASAKLPAVTKDITYENFGKDVPEDRLMILNDSLEKAIQAYEDAKVIIQMNKSKQNEVLRILKKYKIPEEIKDPVEIRNRVWNEGYSYIMKSSAFLGG